MVVLVAEGNYWVFTQEGREPFHEGQDGRYVGGVIEKVGEERGVGGTVIGFVSDSEESGEEILGEVL